MLNFQGCRHPSKLPTASSWLSWGSSPPNVTAECIATGKRRHCNAFWDDTERRAILQEFREGSCITQPGDVKDQSGNSCTPDILSTNVLPSLSAEKEHMNGSSGSSTEAAPLYHRQSHPELSIFVYRGIFVLVMEQFHNTFETQKNSQNFFPH